jgi:hypothetical protein
MAAYSYCFKCSVLLREKDFAKGKAFKIGENVACDKCAAGLMPPPAAPEKKRETAPRARATSVRVKAIDAAYSAPAPDPGAIAASRRKRALLAGLGGFALAGVVLIFLFMPTKVKPEAAPELVEDKPPAGVSPKPAVELVKPSAKELAAREALEAARRLAQEKPADFAAQARAFEDLSWTWEGTAAAEEARKELAAVKVKVRETVSLGLVALDVELDGPLSRDEFGAAFDLLDASAQRILATEWTAGLTSRVGIVESKARLRLPDVVRRALDHQAKGDKAQVDRLLAQVEAWKMPRLLASFKEQLEAVDSPTPPAPAVAAEEKPRSAEGKAWLEAWRSIAVKATARDFAAASAELKKAAAELREEDVRKEAAADAEDLRALGELHRAILDAAAALPAGKELTVEVRGAEGPRRVSGLVARNGRERVELRTGKGPAFAEWSEVTAAGFARVPRPRKPEDTRLLALLALLEGDVEVAKSLLGEATASLPPKAWAYAVDAKGKIPAVPREEGHARELYYAAEREFGAMETRGLAVEKYRTLKNELAATAVARGDFERILRRSEACKEYLITAADARIAGTFKRMATGDAVSAKDSDAENAVDNTLDMEFYALPGTSYRAWLQLGGCCREVFSFFLQGTEMTASDKGKKIAIEPGGDRAEWVPSSVTSLKKEHKDHAKNKEPKGPARWEWVPLNLPKYATPGLKKIRLMTFQQGFGLRQAVVSSTRTAAPKPPELEEMAKARAADVPPVVGDPDLILHWTLDEPDGPFGDLTGHDFIGTPAGAVKRVPGRIGGAAGLDGGGGYIVGKDAPELRLTGDMTIAFWMRKSAEQPDWVRLVGKGSLEKRNFGVWEEPGDGKKILWQIYKEGGGVMISQSSNATVEVGKWHHVACVRRGKLGVLYIDGRKDAQADCDGTPATMDAPVTAGFGEGAGHTYFNGALDDVRIYRRALSDEEITTVFQSGQ